MKLNMRRLSRPVIFYICIGAGLLAIAWLSRPLWLGHTAPLRMPAAERTENGSLSSTTPRAKPPGTPVVNAAAFRNQGYLAFVWRGLLYELDGSTGEVRQLTRSGEAMGPAWSYDGKWLAYITVPNQYAATGSLWIIRRDSTKAHLVQGLAVPVGNISWSPVSDVLTISDLKSRFWLVPADGRARAMDKIGAWSPDGRFFAYSATLPWSNPLIRTDVLYTVSAGGGKPALAWTAPRGGQITVAAWWPDGKGLLYWLAPTHGCSIMADGLNLWSLRLGATTPKLLASCLVNPDWLSFSPQGKLLMVKGNSRFPWESKELAIADVKTGSVEDLPNPEGDVALDPAWSLDGKYIAFVAARDLGPKAMIQGQTEVESWMATRTLWIENSDGSGAHPLTEAGRGVTQPTWSKDGSKILYFRDDAIWMINAGGGSPQRIIAGPSLGTQGDLASIDYAWFQP